MYLLHAVICCILGTIVFLGHVNVFSTLSKPNISWPWVRFITIIFANSLVPAPFALTQITKHQYSDYILNIYIILVSIAISFGVSLFIMNVNMAAPKEQ